MSPTKAPELLKFTSILTCASWFVLSYHANIFFATWTPTLDLFTAGFLPHRKRTSTPDSFLLWEINTLALHIFFPSNVHPRYFHRYFLAVNSSCICLLVSGSAIIAPNCKYFSDMKAEEFSCVLNKSVPRRREMRPLEVSHLKQVFSSKLSFRKSDISIILLFNSVISGENTKNSICICLQPNLHLEQDVCFNTSICCCCNG